MGCDKQFNTKPSLKRDTKSHEQPHSSIHCAFCDNTYANADSLRKHVGIKHKETLVASVSTETCDFLCCFCSDSFSNRNDLLIHLNVIHEKMIQKEHLTCASKPDFDQFVASFTEPNFINRKRGIKKANGDMDLYLVCGHSKESARTKLSSRTERPVRQQNAMKKEFNCFQ